LNQFGPVILGVGKNANQSWSWLGPLGPEKLDWTGLSSTTAVDPAVLFIVDSAGLFFIDPAGVSVITERGGGAELALAGSSMWVHGV